jgi:Ca2+-binding RTX toxin-like protein
MTYLNRARARVRTRAITAAALAAAACAVAAAAAPDPADAGTLKRPFPGSDTIIYEAKSGETNRVSIDQLEGTDTLRILDSGKAEKKCSGSLFDSCDGPEEIPMAVTLSADTGCVRITNVSAQCSATRVTVQLGDKNDEFLTDTPRPVSLFGGAGDDRYNYVDNPGASRVTFQGDSGVDTANYAAAGGGVDVNVKALEDPDGRADDQDHILNGVERLIGSRFDDVLRPDNVSGGILLGGQGNDQLIGQGGVDFFEMGIAADGGDTITAGPEDTVSYARRTKPVNVVVGRFDRTDGESLEGDTIVSAGRVEGGRAGDSIDMPDDSTQRIEIFGGEGNDFLSGGGGNDQINGGPGIDHMSGRDGNDSLQARDGEKDSVFCGGSVSDFTTADAPEKIITGCKQLITSVGGNIGVLKAGPTTQFVAAGADANVRVAWRHPKSWRALRAIEVRLRDDGQIVARKRIVVSGEAGDRAARSGKVIRRGRGASARAALRVPAKTDAGRLSVDVVATDVRGKRQDERDAAFVHVAR